MHQLAEGIVARGRRDRPPPRVLQAAKDSYGQRVPPAELAPLLWDSDAAGRRVDAAEPGASGTGVGGGASTGPAARAGARRLVFGTDGLGVELAIEASPGVRPGAGPAVRSLHGRLLPPACAALFLVRDTGGPVPVPVDDAGCFRADGVAPGLLRLRAVRPGRRHLHTAWILVD